MISMEEESFFPIFLLHLHRHLPPDLFLVIVLSRRHRPDPVPGGGGVEGEPAGLALKRLEDE